MKAKLSSICNANKDEKLKFEVFSYVDNQKDLLYGYFNTTINEMVDKK